MLHHFGINSKLEVLISKRFWLCLGLGIWIIVFPHQISAAADPVSSGAPVSASVPASGDHTPPPTPILIAPKDGAVLNSKPIFIFNRTTDTSSYDLYLDGVVYISDIPDGQNRLTQDWKSTSDTVERKITLNLLEKELADDGLHTWKIIAKDSAGNQTNSATWSFTLDTAPPLILLKRVGSYTDLSLSSEDPSTVPPGTQFTVLGPTQVFFAGTTEPQAVVQITLIPFNEGSSITLTTTANTIGDFFLDRFLPVATYTATVSATDIAANTALLPDFTLAITATLPSPLPTAHPSAQPSGRPIASPPSFVPTPITVFMATLVRPDGTSPTLSLVLLSLLALVILFVLFILWNRQPNFLLLHASTDTPIPGATILFSRYQQPITGKPLSSHFYSLHTTDNEGFTYLPHLRPRSVLTIHLPTHYLLNHKHATTAPVDTHPIYLCLLATAPLTVVRF